MEEGGPTRSTTSLMLSMSRGQEGCVCVGGGGGNCGSYWTVSLSHNVWMDEVVTLWDCDRDMKQGVASVVGPFSASYAQQ